MAKLYHAYRAAMGERQCIFVAPVLYIFFPLRVLFLGSFSVALARSKGKTGGMVVVNYIFESETAGDFFVGYTLSGEGI